MRTERANGRGVERHRTPTLGRLGRADGDAARALDSLLHHRQLSRIEVEVLPPESDDLATSQARGRRQTPQSEELIVFHVVEK